MFLLNLVVMGLYEHLTGFDFTDIITDSNGSALFFALYFIVLFIGDIKRALD